MFELPLKPTNPTFINPKKFILFAHTKVGKTTALSLLPSNLIVDLEEGSNYVESTSINVKDLIEKNNTNVLKIFMDIADKLEQYKKEKGVYPYDYISIDTSSALEEYARLYATVLYKKTPIGKSFTGTDVVAELPNGAGYDWLRKAFDELISVLDGKCNICTIVVAHVKNSSINKNGKDLQAKDLSLTGKLKLIVCAGADAIGFLYRNNKSETILSFKTSEQDLATGARPEHLANREFVLVELKNPNYVQENKPREFVAHWEKIFLTNQ